MNPYLQLNQEMEDANIFDILAKNTDKDKQNKAKKRFVAPLLKFCVPKVYGIIVGIFCTFNCSVHRTVWMGGGRG